MRWIKKGHKVKSLKGLYAYKQEIIQQLDVRQLLSRIMHIERFMSTRFASEMRSM